MDTKKNTLIELVGAENAIDDPEGLAGYSRDHSFVTPLKPWFIVRPKSSEEVQALVHWANRTETPLIPVSSGPPHFHGDTVPSAPECVIVDLSRMNEIKKIDRRNKIAVIEPGVTYGDIKPALAKEGLRIAQPLLPRSNKSVVASLLERQPTLVPRFNYSLPEPLRTCGVVWGTGELCFTGDAGSGPLSLEAQWQKDMAQVDAKGPLATDLMRILTGAQGTMGIVIWASVKCELLPSVHRYHFVPGVRLEDLMEFCYKLERIRLGDEVMVVNRSQLACMLESLAAGPAISRYDLPPWCVVVGLAAAALYPQERVQVQEKELKSLVQEFGLKMLDGIPQMTGADFCALSPEPHWKFKYKGAFHEIFFLTTLDRAPYFIRLVCSVADAFEYASSDIGIYIQPQHQGVSQHIEFTVPFDPYDKAEVERVEHICQQASHKLVADGAYFSRPYGAWAELVYSKDATASRVLKIVKGIVDPKNIMNPGKLCF